VAREHCVSIVRSISEFIPRAVSCSSSNPYSSAREWVPHRAQRNSRRQPADEGWRKETGLNSGYYKERAGWRLTVWKSGGKPAHSKRGQPISMFSVIPLCPLC